MCVPSALKGGLWTALDSTPGVLLFKIGPSLASSIMLWFFSAPTINHSNNQSLHCDTWTSLRSTRRDCMHHPILNHVGFFSGVWPQGGGEGDPTLIFWLPKYGLVLGGSLGGALAACMRQDICNITRKVLLTLQCVFWRLSSNSSIHLAWGL